MTLEGAPGASARDQTGFQLERSMCLASLAEEGFSTLVENGLKLREMP